MRPERGVEAGRLESFIRHLEDAPAPDGLVELNRDTVLGVFENALADCAALDELNLLLSAPKWPGASGMEDVSVIVRRTGRAEVPNAPRWEAHDGQAEVRASRARQDGEPLCSPAHCGLSMSGRPVRAEARRYSSR
jgi:hypothetical protein